MDSSLYSRISEKYEQLSALNRRIEDICTRTEKTWETAAGRQYIEKLGMAHEYIEKMLRMFGDDLSRCSAEEKTEKLEDFSF